MDAAGSQVHDLQKPIRSHGRRRDCRSLRPFFNQPHCAGSSAGRRRSGGKRTGADDDRDDGTSRRSCAGRDRAGGRGQPGARCQGRGQAQGGQIRGCAGRGQARRRRCDAEPRAGADSRCRAGRRHSRSHGRPRGHAAGRADRRAARPTMARPPRSPWAARSRCSPSAVPQPLCPAAASAAPTADEREFAPVAAPAPEAIATPAPDRSAFAWGEPSPAPAHGPDLGRRKRDRARPPGTDAGQSVAVAQEAAQARDLLRAARARDRRRQGAGRSTSSPDCRRHWPTRRSSPSAPPFRPTGAPSSPPNFQPFEPKDTAAVPGRPGRRFARPRWRRAPGLV